MGTDTKIEIDLKEKRRIVLVGAPNVGKSVIFNVLTGTYVTVSNYPGTTVEVTQGLSKFDRRRDVIIDSPGVNSLVPKSEDERVTRDILVTDTPDAVVQVIDAKNIPRNLQITVQLIESGIPLAIALNMFDEALQKGIHIDVKKLQERLGVTVTGTVAVEKEGISRLIHHIRAPQRSPLKIDYGAQIEGALEKLAGLLPQMKIDRRFVCISLLMGDETIPEALMQQGVDTHGLRRLEHLAREAQKKFAKPLSYLINHRRKKVIDGLLKDVITVRKEKKSPIRDRFGALAMSPLGGIPVLLGALALMYFLVGVVGAGWSVDFLETQVFERYVTPFAVNITLAFVPWPLIQEMIAGTYSGAPAGYAGYGLVNMGLTYAIAIILPIVTFFFFFFGLLEDSGYLPRLTVMVNKIFKKVGLNGKAVLPMVLGLGCVTMATLTVRILGTKRERFIATLLLALGIPCSAQLGIIMAMLGAVSLKALLLVFLVVLSQLFLVGYLAARILPGQSSDFLIEIPPVRIPKIVNICVKTYSRVKWFLVEAVPVFLFGTCILFVLDKLGVIARIERAVRPVVVGFLGLPAQATESFLIGFFRRDFGAAGLFSLQKAGALSNIQVVVSMVVITLFVPCLASLIVIFKEQGVRKGLAIVGFVFPFAILVGGILNFVLRYFKCAL